MAKTSINYHTIFNRSYCVNSTPNGFDAGLQYDSILKKVNSIKESGKIDNSVVSNIRKYMRNLSDSKNASRYYSTPFNLIQEFNNIDPKVSDIIVTEYCKGVIPYVDDLKKISQSIERYDLNNNQKNTILRSVSENNVADRILNNYNHISKRFNLDEEVSKFPYKGLECVTETICGFIDTYKLDSYKKMNVCIEEISYLLDKNNFNYSSADLTKNILEYFLLSSSVSDKNIKKYILTLNENCYLTEEDTQPSLNMLQPSQVKETIKDEINSFLILNEKTKSELYDCICNCLNSYSTLAVKSNLKDILYLIWKCIKIEIIDSEKDIDSIFEIFDIRFQNGMFHTDKEDSRFISKEDINEIINTMISFNDVITVSDSNLTYTNTVFKTKLNDFINNNLKNYSAILYPSDNIKAIEFVNSNESAVVPLNERKLFKFHNIVSAAINLDKYLKGQIQKKVASGTNKIKEKVKKVNDILFPESAEDIYQYIGEDGRVDICVAQYYYDESVENEIHETFNSICKDFNYKLQCDNKYTMKSYYIMHPGMVEVHLKESTRFELTEEDWTNVRHSLPPEFNTYISEYANMQEVIKNFEAIDENNIIGINDILTYSLIENNNIDMEHFELALEALSLLNVQKEDVEIFAERYEQYSYNQLLLTESVDENFNREYSLKEKKINKLLSEWKKEEYVPLAIQLEAYGILTDILEDSSIPTVKDSLNKIKSKANEVKNNVKSAVNKTVDNVKKKKKTINLKSLRLYLTGLKAKLKDMDTKQKEVSRQMDIASRNLVKSVKDALISDRREAVIRGSVIPSFSKCLKTSLSLIGLGVITQNAALPFITLIAGLIASKKLTKKERLLLLDEIEVELQVVEKEIQNAESRNQIKKYRALLNYKKDLQRQYQRIRYNIKVGKDILPGSTVGVKQFD
jgi:hypothetical protein